ncbi:MAG: nucleoside triphosphate pyrophosphohydrolase [Anaerolineae bacterium]
MAITIVGLGPGHPGDITRRAWDTLAAAERVFLRTRIHPTVDHLPEGPTYSSFDDLYEAAGDFAAVYDAIVECLLAEPGEIVYAVPGDPLVAEGTVTRLLAVCKEKGEPCQIVSGISFIEPVLAALGVDAAAGLQIADAVEVAAQYHPPLNPDSPALLAQVYSPAVASDLKLTLMNQYPDEHIVALIRAAGTADESTRWLHLYEIDRGTADHLTALYVPAVETGAVTSFEGFQNTVAHLRAPDGCPWDREQTHESLRKYLVEETYEVIDAIEDGDPAELAGELGDLLLQIVLHTQIATEAGDFQMIDIVNAIDSKMKRRHPHVWGTQDVKGSAEKVVANWQAIKAAERAANGQAERSVLDGVPRSMPALAQGHAYDQRAIRVGFDWEQEAGGLEKIQEEISEIQQATTPQERFEEFGDLLLTMVVWARWLSINPEDALRAANQKFYRRFTFMEKRARAMNRAFNELTLAEMDVLWNEAKAAEAK